MEISFTHTILWIDDQVIDAINSFFAKAGFRTIIKSCYKEGIEFLESTENRKIIDAVILDVNCKIDNSEKEPSAAAFRDCSQKVYSLCSKQSEKFIPWFVLTAGSGYSGAESLDMMIPKQNWTLKQYYFKDFEEISLLVSHIKQLTASADNVALRNQYPGVWGVCHESAEVSLLRVFEKIKKDEKCADTSIFVDMRAVLAATVTRGKQCGLFPDFVSRANDAKSLLRTLSQGDEPLVPLYISYNYSALCDTVNNGCHTEDEDAQKLKVHPDVSSGKAPYLINTAFYQLLTILKWFGMLSIGEKRVSELRERVNNILGIPAMNGHIHLYKKNNLLVYKKCVASCKDKDTLDAIRPENEFFSVEQIELNNNPQSSKEYPYFIKVSLV